MTEDREKQVEEQLRELQDIYSDEAYTDIVYANRVTPPSPHQEVNVYKKERLRLENIRKFLPAERVVHHLNGDITYVLENRGALRFLNMRRRKDELLELFTVVHE